MITVNDVVEHAKTIANGEHEVVKPGMELEISEACSVGDAVWQGDLGIGITNGGPPEGYHQIKPSELDNLCLVPKMEGQDSIGSKHCLESTKGVEIWIPENWTAESLDGPYLKLENGVKIVHPKHGDVAVPSCFNEVQIFYQREWDEELKRERRARD